MSKRRKEASFKESSRVFKSRRTTPVTPKTKDIWHDVDNTLFADPILESLSNNDSTGESNWREVDNSLFSDINLDSLSSHDSTKRNRSKNNYDLHNLSDDSLFGDIPIPDSENATGNLGGTPIELVMPNTMENDRVFSEIDLETLSGGEEYGDKSARPDQEHDDNGSNFASDENVFNQCTQQFLKDLVFKKPSPSEICDKAAEFTSRAQVQEITSKNLIQGTQYETHEEIFNRTLMVTNKEATVKSISSELLSDLAFSNWPSQIFSPVPIENIPSKGEFYGLPNKVKDLIFEHKGINALYEWQNECLNLPAVKQRRNLIYALPTSGGKTLVAEILMLREIVCREKNVLFILPYVSIVQEKVSAMSPFGLAMGFFIDEYTAGRGKCPPVQRRKGRSIFIASIEKGAVLFDSLIEAKRANEIGLVVVDELHLIGEKGRGGILEALLTKVMFLNAGIQIVGMSATIGNLPEISAFLKADVYTRGFRPVELKEYIKCGNDILEINAAGQTIEDIFVHKRSVNFKYSAAVARCDPDHLAGLVCECAPENCVLVFCPTRKNCENVAMLLRRILPKSKFLDYRRSEKMDLMDALDKICGILSPVLAETIPYGIAYHHSGLTTEERKFIETAYRFGVLSVICCTSTLAAGVNLPAKRVIIRAPYIGSQFLTLSRYKQMVGRAGRAGMGDAGESILIISSADNARIGDLFFSPMDNAMSSLYAEDNHGLQNLILSAVGLEIASCRRDLCNLLDGTLLAVQSDFLKLDTQQLVLTILREMFKNKVLTLSCEEKSNSSVIVTSQDAASVSVSRSQRERQIFISKSTRFKLTKIGKAAFKSGIDYKRAYAMYSELKAAQNNMILANAAHLLYLIVCFNSNPNGDEMFAAAPSILVSLYPSLDSTTQSLFRLLGFNDAHLAKIAKTLSIQGPLEAKLNRLFKTLILVDIMNIVPVPTVAARYGIERGLLQNLISQSVAAASAIVRFCEQMDELWCFQSLFEKLVSKIDHCGTVELEPLLELPAVKINRAKQLYTAGYRTISDIAKCRPIDLVRSVEHMPLKIAKEIISAAKIILMKKLDYLEEEAETLKSCLKPDS